MRPEKALPICGDFSSPDEYVEELLRFATTSDMFQVLCGGVHILDFFTSDPGLFRTVLPQDWQGFLLKSEPMDLLNFLMRDDLDTYRTPDSATRASPPDSLVQYVRDIRRLTLCRSFLPRRQKIPVLPRHIAMGMKPKKMHEVANFAGYLDDLSKEVRRISDREVTHFVDFGSGQNYLGRTLASPPYNRHVVAVEGKEANNEGAKNLDALSGFAKKEKVMRNKKLFMQVVESRKIAGSLGEKPSGRAARPIAFTDEEIAAADLRPSRELQTIYMPEEGKGFIQYVTGQLENADLSDVFSQIESQDPSKTQEDLCLMAVSIHSCGNLSHYGIRSLISTSAVQAVAIVGCCYNLLTERLGPPTYKFPSMRPSLQAINGRVVRESERRDPQGFPMSHRLVTYGGHGIRLNITARMMACQAPQNWTEKESDEFFTRHFYRAVLQKIFLDKGVVAKVQLDREQEGERSGDESPFNMSTNPVIIGSLRKRCYTSLNAYVRGAVAKLTTDADFSRHSPVVRERMGDMTDEEIEKYELAYRPRKRELSSMWSLMAFNACVAESLIVTDRWLFLREHEDVVRDCWVEAVFDYRESPRNLVVIGIKK